MKTNVMRSTQPIQGQQSESHSWIICSPAVYKCQDKQSCCASLWMPGQKECLEGEPFKGPLTSVKTNSAVNVQINNFSTIEVHLLNVAI